MYPLSQKAGHFEAVEDWRFTYIYKERRMGLPSVLVFPVSVILIICLCVPLPLLAEVTCTIPSVEHGKMTMLTCHFNMNMQENRQNIVVTRKTSDSAEHVDILDCYWKDNNYKCKTFLHQLRVISSIGENLTLELHQAREEDEGDYICVILPENSDAYTCSFSLLKSVSMAAGTADTVIADKEVSSDKPPEGQDEDKGDGTTAIIGGVIGALVAVVLVGLVIWKRDLLLAACDKKKSTSLKERDAEAVPLQTSATKEKPLDEKPQAAVTDGGDKSTSETPVVTVHPTEGSDIPVHSGQGEGQAKPDA